MVGPHYNVMYGLFHLDDDFQSYRNSTTSGFWLKSVSPYENREIRCNEIYAFNSRVVILVSNYNVGGMAVININSGGYSSLLSIR